MALTLVSTPASASANSYCTAAEGDAYHEGHSHASIWAAATAGTKEAALVHATRLLDLKYKWKSWPTTTTQALLWPRSSVMDFLQLSFIDSMTIPSHLKNATAELARLLIGSDITAESDIEANGLTGLKVGSIELSFSKDFKAEDELPDSVTDLIPEWWGTQRGTGFCRPLKRW